MMASTDAASSPLSITPSPSTPLKKGKELWSSAKKLEGRASEGKEALDAMHDHTLTYMRTLFQHAKRRLAEDHEPCSNSSSTTPPTAKRANNHQSTTSTSPLRHHHHAAVPHNTPLSAANNCKKQRRSVAEAAQMAQVKQKVALFESFKGPLSPVDAAGVVTAAGVGTTTTTSSSSSSKYHAVFPGLNLGDTMTGMVPRISEEGEDDDMQTEGTAAAATRAAASSASGPIVLDKEMQTGNATSTQHITTALEELQLTEDKPAAAATVLPTLQAPEDEEEEEEEEGPEPIIECNHKHPVWTSAASVAPLGLAPTNQEGMSDYAEPSSMGGFLGMVQKTLGLGKHRPSIPPAAPPVVRKPLEPLPPLQPEDTYVMSESDEDGHSHGMEDDSSEDDEEQALKRRAQKEIPAWARGQALAAALEKQFTTDPREWVDPDTIFPEVASTCNLEEIFKVRKKRYYKRGSSGMWDQDTEKMSYRQVMGFGHDHKKK